jgi:3-methylcrotonyl-CoA carboxylase alpha subunit
MGLKDAAKKLMQEAGVPTMPSHLGDDQAADRLQAEADAIGYSVLIKAVAGGGGKGAGTAITLPDARGCRGRRSAISP